MKCSNCSYDGDTLYQCSCMKGCMCAVCEDRTIVEEERLTCKMCRFLDGLEK